MRHPLIRRVVIAVGAGALAIPFAANAASAAPDQRSALAGSTPTWATSAHRTGTPAGSAKRTVQVSLAPRDAAGAEKLAADVSNPHSANYGHYLSAAQYNQRFGTTTAQVQRVEKYLKQAGLSVDSVADGNRSISVTGTVSALNSAFGTELGTYSYKTRTLTAPSRTVTVPSSVAADILSVGGLTDLAPLRHPFRHQVANDAAPHASSKAAATPPAPSACSAFWGQHNQTMPAAYGRTEFPTNLCGYTPDQLQSAYGVKGSLAQGKDGKGTTVAIVDAYASPTQQADADTFSKANSVPTWTKGQYTEKTFKPFNMQSECAGEDGWWGEEAIDVESAHSLAPGAKIQYVGAKNCDTGLDEALNWIVQHHAANLISNSWGNAGEDIPASAMQAEHAIFTQAAAEGIGVYFSSGDDGDDVTAGDTPSAQPDYPASDPTVTAVGGTSLAVGSDNGYQFELGWGEDKDPVDYTKSPAAYGQALPGTFYAGAGGGTSTVFDQPSYQAGIVPDALARKYGGDAARVVPDVSALADPYTGMAVGRTINGKYTVQTWGGTSLACPLLAAIQADASTGRGKAIGFANPLLYGLHGSKAYHDVVPQRAPVAVAKPDGSSLVTLDHDSSLYTSYGYDNVTGVGSPNGTAFLKAVSGK